MGLIRAAGSRLMATGVPSAGWYAILTGSAMLLLAYLLGSVQGDPAAPFVAAALALTGVWQLERGVRAELRRRPTSGDKRASR